MFIGRNKLIILIAGAIAMVIASCGGNASADRDIELENVRAALASGDLSEATELCNRLVRDSASLSSESLLNLAVAYMAIADNTGHSDTTDVVGSAIDCYRLAVMKDSVAAAKCISNLPSSEYVYALILNNLTHALDTNDSIVPDDFEFVALDSII